VNRCHLHNRSPTVSDRDYFSSNRMRDDFRRILLESSYSKLFHVLHCSTSCPSLPSIGNLLGDLEPPIVLAELMHRTGDLLVPRVG
jgi:hypothetical protein